MADGSVKIDVGLDLGKAEKDLAKLKEKINKAEDALNAESERKNGLERQIEEANKKLEQTKEEAQKSAEAVRDQLAASLQEANDKLVEAWKNAKALNEELRDKSGEADVALDMSNARLAEIREEYRNSSRSEKDKLREQLQEAVEQNRLLRSEANKLAREYEKSNEALRNTPKEVRAASREVQKLAEQYEKAKAAVGQESKEEAAVKKEIDKLNNELDKTNTKIEQGEKNLSDMKDQAGELVRQIEAARPGEALANSLEVARKKMWMFVKYAFGIRSIYILFQRLKSAIKESVKEYAEYDKQAKENLKTMEATKKAIKLTAGSALTSIYNAILPVVQKIANWMLEAANATAKFVAILSGKSSYKRFVVNTDEVAASLEDVSDEADDVADSAKEAKKQLMGFDELNILSNDNTSNNGGNTNSENNSALDGIDVIEEQIDEFDDSKIAKVAKFIRDHLEEIKAILIGIGAVIATLGIGKLLGVLNTALGKTAVGLGLVASGFLIFKDSMLDWINTGEMTTDMLKKIVVGIMLMGAGLSLLTGSWIPLAIAAIVSLIISLPETLNKLADFFEKNGHENIAAFLRGMAKKAEEAREWIRTKVIKPVMDYFSEALTEWNTKEHRGEYESDADWFIHGVLKLPTWEEFKQWAADSAKAILEGFKEGFNNRETVTIEPSAENGEEKGGGIFAAVKRISEKVIKDFKSTFKIGATSSSSQETEEIGKAVDAGLENGIEEKKSGIFDVVKVTGENIVDLWKESFKIGDSSSSSSQETKEIGEAIDDGLKEGIDDQQHKNGIFDVVKVIGENIVDLWKECFDTHSPSEVTRKIGNDVDEGLAKGIEDDTPDIVAAAKDAGDKTTEAFQEGADRTVSIVQQMRTDINALFQGIVQDVANNLQEMRNLMNFSWSIPRPSIPVIKWNYQSVSYGRGQSVSIPQFFVDWYARGGVFDFPQLIGVGENGKEAVVPLENNTEWMTKIADGLMDRLTKANFVNELADAFVRTPLPAMAGGSIIPPNTVQGGAFSGDGMAEAVRKGVYDAIMAMGGMPKSRGTAVFNVNGREFCRATYDDQKAVANEHGISLITTG